MKKILILGIIVLLLTACKADYIVSYENGTFNEQLIIDSSSVSEEELNDVIEAYQDITYNDNGNKKEFNSSTSNLNELKVLYACFNKVYVLDEEEYISLITDGDNLCKSDDITVTFKTDMKVISSNAKKINESTYKWNSLDDGINIQVSKTKKVEKKSTFTKEKNTRMTILLIFVILVIVVSIVIVLVSKKDNKQEISF